MKRCGPIWSKTDQIQRNLIKNEEIWTNLAPKKPDSIQSRQKCEDILKSGPKKSRFGEFCSKMKRSGPIWPKKAQIELKLAQNN